MGACGEGFDDDHAAAAARAGARQEALIIGDFLHGVIEDRRNLQELAEASDVVGAVAIGKQPIVTNAVEAFGENVHQKAPNELARGESHCLPAIGSIEPVVLPA